MYREPPFLQYRYPRPDAASSTLSAYAHYDPISDRTALGIMVEYWCSRNNRLRSFEKALAGVESNLALVPCIGPDCEEWSSDPVRYCIQLVIVDKGQRLY